MISLRKCPNTYRLKMSSCGGRYILQLRWKRFLDNKKGGVKMNSQVSGVWRFFRWVECTPNHTHWVNFCGKADVIMYFFLYLYLYLYLYYFLCWRCARVESWHGTAETINHSARRHQGELLSATLAATVGYTRQLEMFIWTKIQGACHQGELLLATLWATLDYFNYFNVFKS